MVGRDALKALAVLACTSNVTIKMSSRPQSRVYHTAVGVGRKLYVWGGNSKPKIQATIVENFDVLSQAWEKRKQFKGSLPDGFYDMATATDGDYVYSFGGRTASGVYSNAVYQFNLSTLECRELVPANPSHAPKKAYGSGLVIFNEKLVIFGGYNDNRQTDDLHVFDLRTSEFEETKFPYF